MPKNINHDVNNICVNLAKNFFPSYYKKLMGTSPFGGRGYEQGLARCSLRLKLREVILKMFGSAKITKKFV